jgi:hypothetical protein
MNTNRGYFLINDKQGRSFGYYKSNPITIFAFRNKNHVGYTRKKIAHFEFDVVKETYYLLRLHEPLRAENKHIEIVYAPELHLGLMSKLNSVNIAVVNNIEIEGTKYIHLLTEDLDTRDVQINDQMIIGNLKKILSE